MNFKDNQIHNQWNELLRMVITQDQIQKEKWGVQDKHCFEWLAWTTEEFGEFVKEINDLNYERSLDLGLAITEGIQTITLLVKMVSSLMYLSEKGEDED